MKILHVVGARPNFVKIAPIMRAMEASATSFDQMLVHTGQHYDDRMSDVFFRELEIPPADENLGIGSGTHAVQTAKIMLAFEPVVRDYRPDWVVVVGDVNSTLACTLVCSKLEVPVIHVEAGLRSGDRTMPEEINRVVTDHLSTLLLTSSREGDEKLAREGIAAERVHFVGNVMIDTLVRMLPHAAASQVRGVLGIPDDDYILATVHRPSNVDEKAPLGEILSSLSELARSVKVVFPVHPRTRSMIEKTHPRFLCNGVLTCDPLGYVDFLSLTQGARLVLTDSGGLQEETSFLGVPCLTVRPNTERRVTLEQGTNRLLATRRQEIIPAAHTILAGPLRRECRIEGWDGTAAGRVVSVLERIAEQTSA